MIMQKLELLKNVNDIVLIMVAEHDFNEIFKSLQWKLTIHYQVKERMNFSDNRYLRELCNYVF